MEAEAAFRSASDKPSLPYKGVEMGPGLTALTRMTREINSQSVDASSLTLYALFQKGSVSTLPAKAPLRFLISTGPAMHRKP